jgi:hypothetical protein
MSGIRQTEGWLRPRIEFTIDGRRRSFSTPFDTYSDEMEHDRRLLSQVVRLIQEANGASAIARGT